MREHTLIQAPYKQWRSGRVGWLWTTASVDPTLVPVSVFFLVFFRGGGEVRSLLMLLVCRPTSVSFLPAATEGAEPKRKQKKIRLISLTPGKSNRHYPTRSTSTSCHPCHTERTAVHPKTWPANTCRAVGKCGQTRTGNGDSWWPTCIHRTSHHNRNMKCILRGTQCGLWVRKMIRISVFIHQVMVAISSPALSSFRKEVDDIYTAWPWDKTTALYAQTDYWKTLPCDKRNGDLSNMSKRIMRRTG